MNGECPCCKPGKQRYWNRVIGPLPLLQDRNGIPRQHGCYPTWVDHPWKYRCPGRGWVYCAEPYDIGEDALSDLAWLADAHGYETEIETERAQHYPGKTLLIEIWKPRKEPSS